MKRLIFLALLLAGCRAQPYDEFHGHGYIVQHKIPGDSTYSYFTEKVTIGEGFARFYCGKRFYALSGNVIIRANPKAGRK